VLYTVKSLASQQYEEFEDTKGVIRNCKSKKDRQHNDQKDKQRSTKHTYKTKNQETRTPLTRGLVGWACVALLSFCFEET
jgi:hypothetical protein